MIFRSGSTKNKSIFLFVSFPLKAEQTPLSDLSDYNRVYPPCSRLIHPPPHPPPPARLCSPQHKQQQRQRWRRDTGVSETQMEKRGRVKVDTNTDLSTCPRVWSCDPTGVFRLLAVHVQLLQVVSQDGLRCSAPAQRLQSVDKYFHPMSLYLTHNLVWSCSR